jgi:hypothetical protein
MIYLNVNNEYYVVITSGDHANLTSITCAAEPFQVGSTCQPLAEGELLVASNSLEPPGPKDQRGPCPFINTLANHGKTNRNGTFIDLFDLAARHEAVYYTAVEFLHQVPVQLDIDCNQTYYEDEDLERLFDDRCEERSKHGPC